MLELLLPRVPSTESEKRGRSRRLRVYALTMCEQAQIGKGKIITVTQIGCESPARNYSSIRSSVIFARHCPVGRGEKPVLRCGGSEGLARSTGRMILDKPLTAGYIRANRTRDLLEVLQHACTKIDT